MESRFRRYKGAMPTPHAWLSSFVVLLAAASAHGDAAKSRVALDMAQQLVKRGNLPLALEAANTAVSEAPDSAPARRVRADIQEQLAGPQSSLDALADPKPGVD